MAAPTAPVDICSLAMEYLSDQAVTDVDDPKTTPEAICARWYDMVRRSLLRQHPWNFAIKRISLARETVSPVYGYTDAYVLPNDWVRHIEILTTSLAEISDFEIEDGKLLCSNSAGALYVRYIYDARQVAKFDALFVDVLALELAKRICRKITGSNDLISGLNEVLKDLRSDAFTVDGQERPPVRVETSKWRQARTRLSSGRITNKV